MSKKNETFTGNKIARTTGLDHNEYNGKGTRKHCEFRHIIKDNICLIIEAKAPNIGIEDDRGIKEIHEYASLEKEINKTKNIIEVLYNSEKCKVGVNGELKPQENDLDNVAHYIKLIENKTFDNTFIANATKQINEKLNTLGLESLLDRMVWTACCLIACDGYTLRAATAASVKAEIVEQITKKIESDFKRNTKLVILIEEFQSINLNTDERVIYEVVEIVNSLSEYINSSHGKGEDVMAIFFNEFTRYSGKANNGQVFTPEIGTGFMYDLIGIDKTCNVLDAACGSGGFLVKAMSKMFLQCKTDIEKDNVRNNRLFGVEGSRKVFAVACANMLLHHDGKSNIGQGDSTSVNVGNGIKTKNIRKVLMNPPFEAQTGIKILANTLDNIEDGSDVAIILPDRTFYTKSQKVVEHILNNNALTNIIKMPDEVGRGVAGVTTSIFIFKKGISHNNRDVIKYGIKEDGLITVKNAGRHDINRIGSDKLEPYWVDIILNNRKHETRQVSKSLEYELPKQEIKLTVEDFQKVVLDRILFENPQIKEKVDEIKEKDGLLGSLKSLKKKDGGKE